MQASCKEALPLFGILQREEGERGSIATSRRVHRSQIWISTQPGNPRSIRDGRGRQGGQGVTRPSQRSERAGCDDNRVTTAASCLPTIVALVPRDHSPTRKPVPELNERLRASYPMLRRALVSPEAPQVPSHWDSLSFAPSQEWCHLFRFLSLSFSTFSLSTSQTHMPQSEGSWEAPSFSHEGYSAM